MSGMHNIKRLRTGQQGFVSLVVALTLIIILALLTVGFSQLSRQEQQRALDKQLSVQANYASESGISDAIKDINNGTMPNSPNQCLKPPAIPDNPSINSSVNVSYTCLLVNLQPPSLLFGNVGAGSDRTITFSTVSPPARLLISWGSTDPTRIVFSGSIATKFLPQNAWAASKAPAVLQLSVTPYNAGAIDRNSLIHNTFTSYLYPASTGISTGMYSMGISDTPADGPILSGDCSGSGAYPCSATITGLAGSSGPYLVHFLDYYDTSNVRITAVDSTGSPTDFVNGQALIDSTGKAQDVLKRLQVRVSINGNNGGVTGSGLELPDYAIEAQNICKRLETDPVQGTFFDDPATSAHVASGPCYAE